MQVIESDRSPANSPTVWRVAGIVAIVLVLAAVWAGISSHRASAKKLKESEEDQAIVNVVTVAPKLEGIEGDLTLPGSVQANFDAPIYARTSGYLKHWYVDIGATVKQGQLLAQIDAPEVDQQLRQAQSDLDNAEANQKLAKVTAERWRNLRATDSVSSQQADEKISQSASSDAQLGAARANLKRLKDLAGFQRIVAPFGGVVTARNTDVGQLIAAGNNSGPELFRVADVRRLRLYVHIPQSYVAMMHRGLEAKVLFPDRAGVEYKAVLDTTSRALDSSRTLLAQLIIDNANNELLPGAYAEVHFQIPDAQQSGAFKLPTNSIIFRGDGVRVATVDAQNHVNMKRVNIGRDYGVDIEVTEGIDASDKVIVNPPDALVDHAQVRIVQPASPAKSTKKSVPS